MRLYPRNGTVAASVDGVVYEPAEDGGFDFPEPTALHLSTFPHWETHTQREQRRVAEDLARKRDPASQYDEIAALRADLAAGRPDPRDVELAELRGRLAALEDKPSRTRKAADEDPAPTDPAPADDPASVDDEQPTDDKADGEGDPS